MKEILVIVAPVAVALIVIAVLVTWLILKSRYGRELNTVENALIASRAEVKSLQTLRENDAASHEKSVALLKEAHEAALQQQISAIRAEMTAETERLLKQREEELSRAFDEIASLADILVGNEEDFQLCLGFRGPETGGKDLSGKLANFRAMIEQVREKYPNARAYATTLRQVISANEHLWGAVLYADGQWYVEEPRTIEVMDRIGGGDGFSGGLLYGILAGWTPDKWLQFGWAAGVLAASSLNDYAEPADEKQVWDVYKGNARVQR